VPGVSSFTGGFSFAGSFTTSTNTTNTNMTDRGNTTNTNMTDRGKHTRPPCINPECDRNTTSKNQLCGKCKNAASKAATSTPVATASFDPSCVGTATSPATGRDGWCDPNSNPLTTVQGLWGWRGNDIPSTWLYYLTDYVNASYEETGVKIIQHIGGQEVGPRAGFLHVNFVATGYFPDSKETCTRITKSMQKWLAKQDPDPYLARKGMIVNCIQLKTTGKRVQTFKLLGGYVQKFIRNPMFGLSISGCSEGDLWHMRKAYRIRAMNYLTGKDVLTLDRFYRSLHSYYQENISPLNCHVADLMDWSIRDGTFSVTEAWAKKHGKYDHAQLEAIHQSHMDPETWSRDRALAVFCGIDMPPSELKLLADWSGTWSNTASAAVLTAECDTESQAGAGASAAGLPDCSGSSAATATMGGLFESAHAQAHDAKNDQYIQEACAASRSAGTAVFDTGGYHGHDFDIPVPSYDHACPSGVPGGAAAHQMHVRSSRSSHNRPLMGSTILNIHSLFDGMPIDEVKQMAREEAALAGDPAHPPGNDYVHHEAYVCFMGSTPQFKTRESDGAIGVPAAAHPPLPADTAEPEVPQTAFDQVVNAMRFLSWTREHGGTDGLGGDNGGNGNADVVETADGGGTLAAARRENEAAGGGGVLEAVRRAAEADATYDDNRTMAVTADGSSDVDDDDDDDDATDWAARVGTRTPLSRVCKPLVDVEAESDHGADNDNGASDNNGGDNENADYVYGDSDADADQLSAGGGSDSD
jgi:hypothetical protein